jgi:hypothetical protein
MAKEKTEKKKVGRPRKERRMPQYPPKPVGRPPECTQELIKKIVSSILVGNYFETACASAGIHKTTAYDWLKKGAREPGSIFEQFSNAVEKAQADGESRDVMVIEMQAHGAPAQYNEMGQQIREAIPRDWKAAAWRLERKHPKKWGRMDRHEVTGQDGKPIEVKTFTGLIADLEARMKKEEEDGEEN